MADSETGVSGVPNAALNAPVAASNSSVVNSNVPVGPVGTYVAPNTSGVATINPNASDKNVAASNSPVVGPVVPVVPAPAVSNTSIASSKIINSNSTVSTPVPALVAAPAEVSSALTPTNASANRPTSFNSQNIVVGVSHDTNGKNIFHVNPDGNVLGIVKAYNVNLERSGGKYIGHAEETEVKVNSSLTTETEIDNVIAINTKNRIDNALNPSIAVNQSGAVPITSVATTTIPVGDPNTSASIPVNNNAKNKSIKEKAINDIMRMGGRRKIKTIRSKKRKGTRNRRARQ